MISPAAKGMISFATALCSQHTVIRIVNTLAMPSTSLQKVVTGIGAYGIGVSVAETVKASTNRHVDELSQMFVSVKIEQPTKSQ